jgi:hypothetical protein
MSAFVRQNVCTGGGDSRRFCTDSPRVICYSLRKERAPISDVAINKKDLSERQPICLYTGRGGGVW